MPHLFPAIHGLALSVALAACAPSGIDMHHDTLAGDAAATPQADAQYHRNPKPRQAYRITMTINDAPGPFAQMRALAQYDVVNKQCLRPPRENPGGRTSPVPSDDVEIPLQKMSDNQYVGIVYADQMRDQDYTGHGVCHWELIQFRVHMKATGAEEETLFIPSIPAAKALASETVTVYFNKQGYGEQDGYTNTGLDDRSRFSASIRDSDLFTIRFEVNKSAMP